MTGLVYHVLEGDAVEAMKASCQASKHNPGFPEHESPGNLPYRCMLDDGIVAVVEGLSSPRTRVVSTSFCEKGHAVRGQRVSVRCRKPIGEPQVKKRSGSHKGSILHTTGHTLGVVKSACPYVYQEKSGKAGRLIRSRT